MSSSLSLPPKESAQASAEALHQLARHALRYVKRGQTIGLGTGRAATAFIRAVATVGISIRGVPTSSASAELARSLKIELVDLKQVGRLDADFDGADEVDPRLNMIKGRGGAMVRERVVASASRKRIFLVSEEKKVRRLGERGQLPIEVVPFAVPVALQQLSRMGLKPAVRSDHSGREFISDNGNLVLDCKVGPIRNAARLEVELHTIPGVVGTGLFLGVADLVLIISNEGKISTLRRSR